VSGLKCLSLFSGIGGFDLALQRQGHEIVGACEIDKYARQIYAKHFPEVPIHKDATKINPDNLPDFDIIVGGFPCQAFSVAGKRRGFEDTRGTLFFEIARIAQKKRPRYLLLENVKGLLSHERGETFRTILKTLDELGYDTQCSIVNTKDFLPQNRERIFIVATLGEESRREIFPLGEISSISNKKNKGEQGKGTRIRGQDCSSTIDARYGGLRNSGETYLMYYNKSESQAARVYNIEGLCPTLGTGHAMQSPNIAVPVLTPDRKEKRQNGRRFKEDGDPAFTLTAQDRHGIYDGKRIRRLTPKECERLQGFPDNWTEGISDTQRYKCVGNAVTVSVIEHVLERLET